MITDAAIREQGYIYFLAEAPELVQIIEQELFSLSEGYSIAKVHNLMRATHTLKGGAANVGLEVIQMIAHSLEDVFKALYNPEVVIDDELQTLLHQAYECLNLALTTELTGTAVNNEEILQRTTLIFVQLQEKLGDFFGADNHIPTSQELGFDIAQSIFEVGVQQRLESIAEVINNPPDNTEFVEFLSSQAEVFLGLAESLNLPGLAEIAQTILAALQANPQEVGEIAEIALVDLQQAQKDVLAGDRTCGGAPSPSLQRLTTTAVDEVSGSADNFLLNAEEFYKFLTASGNTKNERIKPTTAKLYLKVIYYIFGWFNHYQEISKTELNLSLLIPQKAEQNNINHIESWLSAFLKFVQDEEDSYSLCLYRHGVILIILLAVAKFQYSSDKSDDYILLIQTLQNQIRTLAKEYKNYPPVTSEEKNWLDSPKLRQLLVFKEISIPASPLSDGLLESIWGGEAEPNVNPEIELSVVADVLETGIEAISEPAIQIHESIEEPSPSPQSNNARKSTFIRVEVEGLQRLNYLAGELLIHQKRRTLYDEQIQEILEQLLQRLSKHQDNLNQLRDLPVQIQNFTSLPTQNFASVKFDSLEMDVYTEFHLSLHEAIEETLQLQETTESLDLLLKQATQISEAKQNLAFNLIDNLVEARMLPLGNVLNRFPQMVKQLGRVYHKLVNLQLSGTGVLVDKAIAEKLYDPLLHLVRNAFDHGIESPQVRQERGKPEQGTIEICAYHQGSQTIIEVRDDGQGLNLESIRKKAIELNLISDNEQSKGYFSNSDKAELLDLMFLPGFSTTDQVNEISGRGMGLDIVRSQLQALNGSISVQFLPNQGTTFILKVPFSMTTDKLMLVQAGGVVYALLLDSIEKILIPSTQQVKEFEGKRVLHWHTDEDETLVNLHQFSDLISYKTSVFNSANLNNTPITNEAGVMKNPVLLLRRKQGVFGLEVDQILGEQELVIRPLGNAIAPPKYIYGCSSLANGNLILVIDGTLLLESQDSQIQLDIAALPIVYSSGQKALPMSVNQEESLPLLAASANSIEPPTQSLESNHQAPKVILVVDDAISLRQTLSLTLQKSGYQVIQAQNGVEALEQLQRHADIQVIISDLEMPRMNGFELLGNLRQNPNFVNIPIVILTSRSAEKHRQLAQELGANAYLTKPYLEHEFLSIVNSLINKDEKKSLD
ncbi:MAG: hybrid sensor histidine kinase/response regulator [Nostoc sp. LLA-1]|nr:hybrid sensor histidine kinase/response regulator [Cyanocohniella sp. LLY]